MQASATVRSSVQELLWQLCRLEGLNHHSPSSIIAYLAHHHLPIAPLPTVSHPYYIDSSVSSPTPANHEFGPE